jgi:hypothetical protein
MTLASDSDLVVVATPVDDRSPTPSAVAWGAVLAGAFAATATTFVLIALGSGFGLAIAPPWAQSADAAAGLVIDAGIWLIVTQWISAGIGGYLTGRLRIKWAVAHTDEVFFRDTANGFLAWAVSTVAVVALVAAASLVAAHAASSVAMAAPDPRPDARYAYTADSLFRAPRPDDTPSAAAAHAEAAAILARQAVTAAPSADDRAYLINLVQVRTGIAPADAAARVTGAIANVRDGADKARKAASATSIITAIAMLVGALIASLAAALGGKQRDEHP